MAMVDIRDGERGPVALLMLYACCMGVGNVFLDASANAFFLGYFPVSRLPYVYLASAASTVLFGFTYARLEQRVRPLLLLAGTLVSLILMLAMIYGGMLGSSARWLAVIAMMWKDVQFILSGMVLWALAGMIFNLRQGKRLFGLVGAGDVLAIIGGGLAVPLVVRGIGTVHLLAVALAAQAFSLLLLVTMATRFRDRMATLPAGGPEVPKAMRRRSFATLLRDRYIVLLFAISVMSYLAYYLIDYSFYDRVQAQFATPERVASFYGLFLAATGVVNLLSNVFLSGPLLTRYGVGLGLLVLPFVDGIGGVSSALAAGTAVFAWLLFATKLGDEVLRKSIEGPVYRILYQPLRKHERLRVQALRESVVEPIAIGMSGLLLIGLTSGLHIGPAGLIRLLCGIVVVWIAAAFLLSRSYIQVLASAIGRRSVGGVAGVLQDGRGRKLVESFLTSGSTAEVLWALHVTEESDPAKLVERCIALLDHHDAEVRRYALGVLERRVPVAARGAIQERTRRETDPVTRGAALRTLCAFLEFDAIDDVMPFVTGSDIEARHGALVGLLRYGGIDGVLAAGPKLQLLVESSAAEERAAGARIIGDAGVPGFYRPLRALLTDDDLSVRRAALRAAGALGSARIASDVVDQLFVSSLADAAGASLRAMGPVAVAALIARFESPDLTAGARGRIARLIGVIGGAEAEAMLVAQARHPEPTVRGQVLETLVRSGWRASSADRVWLGEQLRAEVAALAQAHAMVLDVGEQSHPALRSALHQETVTGRQRLLSLLALLHPGAALHDAARGLMSDSAERRAQALEVLESTILRSLRASVIPLLDDLSHGERVSRLSSIFAYQRRTATDRVRSLVDAGPGPRWSSWLRAVGLYVAALDPDIDTQAAVRLAMSDPEPLVREAARWAVGGKSRLPTRGWSTSTA